MRATGDTASRKKENPTRYSDLTFCLPSYLIGFIVKITAKLFLSTKNRLAFLFDSSESYAYLGA
jgi:hypothetical protein